LLAGLNSHNLQREGTSIILILEVQPSKWGGVCVCKIFRTYLSYLLIFNKLIKCILFGTRCQNWQYLQQMFLFLAKSPHFVTKRKGSANQDSCGKNWPSQT
jgi:hypothetical protein